MLLCKSHAADAPKTTDASVQSTAYQQPISKKVAVQVEIVPLIHVGQNGLQDLNSPLHEAEQLAKLSLNLSTASRESKRQNKERQIMQRRIWKKC